MVNFCAVVGCSNRGNRDQKSFYRLPSARSKGCDRTIELSLKRRKKWLARICRDIKPSSFCHTRVCSDHFISGKPSDLFDISNPDWAPTLNLGHDKGTAVTANRDGNRHRKVINTKNTKKSKCNNKLNMDTSEKTENCSVESSASFSNTLPGIVHCEEGPPLTVKFEVEDQRAYLQQREQASQPGNESDADSVQSASQLSNSGVFIDDAEVIQLWRLIGERQEVNTDVEIAKFLLTLYFSPRQDHDQLVDRCGHCQGIQSQCCVSRSLWKNRSLCTQCLTCLTSTTYLHSPTPSAATCMQNDQGADIECDIELDMDADNILNETDGDAVLGGNANDALQKDQIGNCDLDIKVEENTDSELDQHGINVVSDVNVIDVLQNQSDKFCDLDIKVEVETDTQLDQHGSFAVSDLNSSDVIQKDLSGNCDIDIKVELDTEDGIDLNNISYLSENYSGDAIQKDHSGDSDINIKVEMDTENELSEHDSNAVLGENARDCVQNGPQINFDCDFKLKMNTEDMSDESNNDVENQNINGYCNFKDVFYENTSNDVQKNQVTDCAFDIQVESKTDILGGNTESDIDTMEFLPHNDPVTLMSDDRELPDSKSSLGENESATCNGTASPVEVFNEENPNTLPSDVNKNHGRKTICQNLAQSVYSVDWTKERVSVPSCLEDHTYSYTEIEVAISGNPYQKRKANVYCAVAGCKNAKGRGLILHTFPSDEKIRKQWIQFVEKHRPDFGTPSKSSAICEKHFTPDCYPIRVSLKRSFGLKTTIKLKKDAVPTIQTLASLTSDSTCVTTSGTSLVASPGCSVLPGVSRMQGAYAMREHERMLDNIISSYSADQDTSSSKEESPAQPHNENTKPFRTQPDPENSNVIRVYPDRVDSSLVRTQPDHANSNPVGGHPDANSKPVGVHPDHANSDPLSKKPDFVNKPDGVKLDHVDIDPVRVKPDHIDPVDINPNEVNPDPVGLGVKPDQPDEVNDKSIRMKLCGNKLVRVKPLRVKKRVRVKPRRVHKPVRVQPDHKNKHPVTEYTRNTNFSPV